MVRVLDTGRQGEEIQGIRQVVGEIWEYIHCGVQGGQEDRREEV